MSLADVQVEAPKNCLKVMKQMCPKIGAHADPVITRNHSKGNQRLGRKPDALERWQYSMSTDAWCIAIQQFEHG